MIPAARPLAIAHIGTMDQGGGAAAVASGLARASAEQGHRVWHVVGRKRGDDPHTIMLPDDDRPWLRATGYGAAQRALRRLAARHPDRGFGLISRALRLAAHPRVSADRRRGLEDFEFPASHRLFDVLGRVPDIVHGHNLHGGYFDLRALAAISTRVPTLLTLHDMWLLTGHCAHALHCEKWRSGCGHCPDLARDPAIRRDATDVNWRRKRDVYAASRLFVATPSEWLRTAVAQSMLAPYARAVRVIPNGVDTAVFRPADRRAARAQLRLPAEGPIVLLTTGSRGSMWKDDRTLQTVMARAAGRHDVRPLFVAVGRESAVRATAARAMAVPFVHEPRVMAGYYQAADVYLHAARADTFPLAVLEAMACGTPVIASAVGGIVEQIDSGVTGVLVSSAADMAQALDRLLDDPELRTRIGAEARAAVLKRYALARQVDAYLQWYRELVANPS